MVGKESLVTWFKHLESYKRIDVMCTLLNMCLPFELRFLGTCLEELGRRDAQDLRFIEQRVNNPQEFVTEIGSFQAGEPTDVKIRRKMALYLALMRACNRTCVNELFKILDEWGDRDFSKFGGGDPLQELLLVYTMAINHPVFSFEQRSKCGEIFGKINSKCTGTPPAPSNSPPARSPLASANYSPASQSTQPAGQPFVVAHEMATTPIHQQMLPQAMLMGNQIQLIQQPLPIVFGQQGMTQMLTSDVGQMGQIETMPQIQMTPSLMIPQDFSVPPPWTSNQYRMYSTTAIESSFPPAATSPMLSQPSSPSHSRAESPTRQPQSLQLQSQPHRNQTRTVRQNRRPSTETTPPPPIVSAQPQLSNITYVTAEMTPSKNYDELNAAAAMTQLHQLQNGYVRSSHHTIPRQSNKTYLLQHYHQQQHQHQQFNYQMHNMSLMDPSQAGNATLPAVHHSGDSSGSSHGSASELSPPDTPGIAPISSIPPKKSLTMQRLNGGRTEKNYSKASAPLYAPPPAQSPQQQFSSASNASNNNSSSNQGTQEIGAQSPPPGVIQLIPHSSLGSRQMPPPTFRHTSQAYQMPNGELAFQPYTPQVTYIPAAPHSHRSSPSAQQIIPPVIPLTPLIPALALQPKSCFNCGSTSHTGRDCPEASMEDVTRPNVYKLDFTSSMAKPPQPSPSNSTSSVSNLSNSAISGNLVESIAVVPAQQLNFIDLTQDTSSSSASSSSSRH